MTTATAQPPEIVIGPGSFYAQLKACMEAGINSTIPLSAIPLTTYSFGVAAQGHYIMSELTPEQQAIGLSQAISLVKAMRGGLPQDLQNGLQYCITQLHAQLQDGLMWVKSQPDASR